MVATRSFFRVLACAVTVSAFVSLAVQSTRQALHVATLFSLVPLEARSLEQARTREAMLRLQRQLDEANHNFFRPRATGAFPPPRSTRPD